MWLKRKKTENNKWKIISPNINPRETKVFYGGKEVTGIVAIDYHIDINGGRSCILTIKAYVDIEITGDGQITPLEIKLRQESK